MIVISDTSPINYLCQIGHINILPTLFGRVVIPAAERAELLASTAPESVRQIATNPPEWLQVRSPSTNDPTLARFGAGERESIVLAQELHADLIVTDDLEARRMAASRQLMVVGTIGVLKMAADRQLVDLSKSIDDLVAAGFYVSDELLKRLRDDVSR